MKLSPENFKAKGKHMKGPISRNGFVITLYHIENEQESREGVVTDVGRLAITRNREPLVTCYEHTSNWRMVMSSPC